MDLSEAELLRDVLHDSGWVRRTREFARALRTTTRSPGGLLLFGPAENEPWHLTAHLDDEARLSHIPEIAPTLVRWNPAPGAPAHLAIGLERLREARRGESLLVVADFAPDPLLERVEDVRRKGATVFALESGHTDLASLAHEALSVDHDDALVSFDTAQHLVSLAAAEPFDVRSRGFRARLNKLLDLLSGPSQ